jgi:hypothetical protein
MRDPERYIDQIRELYKQVQIDTGAILKHISNTLDGKNENAVFPRGVDMPSNRLFVRLHLLHSLLLSIAMLLNCILQACSDRVEERQSMLEDAAVMCEASLQCGINLLSFRPLYSVGVTNTLKIAWALTTNEAIRHQIHAVLRQYSRYEEDPTLLNGALWVRGYRERLSLKHGRVIQDQLYNGRSLVQGGTVDVSASTRCVIL